MGAIYETVVTCIGIILFVGAIILVMFGYFVETGAFNDLEIPKPQAPEIYDAEYTIVDDGCSPHSKTIVNPTAIS